MAQRVSSHLDRSSSGKKKVVATSDQGRNVDLLCQFGSESFHWVSTAKMGRLFYSGANGGKKKAL